MGKGSAQQNPTPTEEDMGANFTTIEADRPRIYVACLAAYNSGILHGAWIDAARDVWEVWEDIQTMLRASPIAGAEEHAIHDYDGFGGVRLSESEDIDTVTEIAAFVVEHGALGAAVLAHCDDDLEEAREAITDRYLGLYDSLADYMQELTEETTAIPQALRYYIDYQAMARDAEMGGDLFTIETGYQQVHVFSAR
jgi:antirestriction protein